MSEELKIPGRSVSVQALEELRQGLVANPQWSRRRLAQELATCWDWRNRAGQLKGLGRPHAVGEASPVGLDCASGAAAGANPPDALREAVGGRKAALALYRAAGGGMAQRGDPHPHSELPPVRGQSSGISDRGSRAAARGDPQPGSRSPPWPVAPSSSGRRSRGPIAGTCGRPGLAGTCVPNDAYTAPTARPPIRCSAAPLAIRGRLVPISQAAHGGGCSVVSFATNRRLFSAASPCRCPEGAQHFSPGQSEPPGERRPGSSVRNQPKPCRGETGPARSVTGPVAFKPSIGQHADGLGRPCRAQQRKGSCNPGRRPSPVRHGAD